MGVSCSDREDPEGKCLHSSSIGTGLDYLILENLNFELTRIVPTEVTSQL